MRRHFAILAALYACAEAETPPVSTCDAKAEELRKAAELLREAQQVAREARAWDPDSERSLAAMERVEAASMRLTHAQQDYASCPR